MLAWRTTRRPGAEAAARRDWRHRSLRAVAILVVAALVGPAAPPVRADPPRVVAVRSSELPLYDDVIAGFREGLGSRVDVVTLPGTEAEARRFVEGLNRLPPALFLTLGAAATSLVHRQVPDVPVVYARVLSNVEGGRSTDDLTGVRQLVPASSQLRLLLRIAPRTHRIGVPFDPDRSTTWITEVERAAKAAGVEVVRAAASDKSNAAEALAKVTGGAEPVDALWVAPDRTWINPDTVPLLLRTAREKRVPLLAHAEQLVEEGALAAAYVDDHALGRSAAALARRVLAGEPAAQVPVADPPASIAINAAVAAELGLTVPGELLAEAAKVVR
ncbi:MAG: hypothetical protein IPK07_23155 [Deltaproteobacteria bacterium]|nr:hypothetical protein [Deltaproteobacteria bacterium]